MRIMGHIFMGAHLAPTIITLIKPSCSLRISEWALEAAIPRSVRWKSKTTICSTRRWELKKTDEKRPKLTGDNLITAVCTKRSATEAVGEQETAWEVKD